jgi:hypothetical protein
MRFTTVPGVGNALYHDPDRACVARRLAGIPLAMNVLFLSNPARGYYRFFNSLAGMFKADGHSVVFAVDCDYSAYLNRVAATGFPVHVFSEFFSGTEPDEEILEEYSGFNLNSMLLPDYDRARVFRYWERRGGNYYDSLKSALLSFYTKIFQRHAIDLVVFENVAGAFAHTAWAVCQKRGVRYVGLTSTRLPGRFAISSDPLGEWKPIERILAEIGQGSVDVPEDVRRWSEEYLDNIDRIVPDYMKFNGLDRTAILSDLAIGERFRIWAGAMRFMFSRHEYAFGIGNPLRRRWEVLRRTIARRCRLPALERYYDAPVEGETYLLYPLHYHPEASTSLLSGAYLDEYEVIRNIAFNLPQGVKLYVKDHLSGRGFPPVSFYRNVASLPNVRLIRASAPTKQLIRDSKAVITLTSTVGYEALLLGKRVFLYGTVFYEFHPNVVRVQNPSALFSLLEAWLDRPLEAGRDYNLEFVQAYYLSTLPGVLNLAGRDAARLAQELYPHLMEWLHIAAHRDTTQ